LRKQFDDFDCRIAEIQLRLTANEDLIAAIEKQTSALAIQRSRAGLGAWSPDGLAAALADMPAAELTKLLQ
jgi:hypothetical protein